jgi:Ca2+-binding EF-hand superfamily protein
LTATAASVSERANPRLAARARPLTRARALAGYQELMLTAVNKKLLAKEERMWESFRALDKNGDGVLSAEEIMQAFGDDKERARSLIAEVDRNGDGMINYDEFMSALASKEEDL